MNAENAARAPHEEIPNPEGFAENGDGTSFESGVTDDLTAEEFAIPDFSGGDGGGEEPPDGPEDNWIDNLKAANDNEVQAERSEFVIEESQVTTGPQVPQNDYDIFGGQEQGFTFEGNKLNVVGFDDAEPVAINGRQPEQLNEEESNASEEPVEQPTVAETVAEAEHAANVINLEKAKKRLTRRRVERIEYGNTNGPKVENSTEEDGDTGEAATEDIASEEVPLTASRERVDVQIDPNEAPPVANRGPAEIETNPDEAPLVAEAREQDDPTLDERNPLNVLRGMAAPVAEFARNERANAADFMENLRGLSEKPKSWARAGYEMLYRIPIANRLVAKMEMGANQLFANKFGEYNAKIATKLSGVETQHNALSAGISQLEAQRDRLQATNPAAANRLQLQINKREQQLQKIESKRDLLNTKVENRNQIVAGFEDRRNAIAEKMIGKYNERMRPFESRLEGLQSEKDMLETRAMAVEIDLRDYIEEVKQMETDRFELEKTMREAGLSDREIKATTKVLDETINERYRYIDSSRADITGRIAEVDKKITTTQNQARPYQQKARQFKDVQSRGSMQSNVPVGAARSETLAADAANENSQVPSELEDFGEGIEASNEKFPVGEILNKWNTYLEEESSIDNKQDEFINVDRFLGFVNWNAEKEITVEDFKDIMKHYHKAKKHAADRIDEYADDFFEQKVKQAA